MKELVTIIVPVYKVEKYLNRCVDSIIRQTYKNLEIILVDDGSPDGCGEICDRYSNMDRRVKVIHKENGGLSDARNAGIEIAQGNYISFVDSDDWIHEEYVSKLYQLIMNSDSDISVCNFIRTSNENVQFDLSKEKIHEYSNTEALEKFTNEFYVQMVVAWGKLYKKNLFEDIRFPVGRIHEDDFTTYKLVYKATKITVTTAQLLYYWQREDSIIGTGFVLDNELDRLAAFEERALFLKKIGLEDLSSKTYKNIFFIYLKIIDHINEFKTESEKIKFELRFNLTKNILRQTNQKIIFKTFYRVYYVAPRTMNLCYRVLETARRKI